MQQIFNLLGDRVGEGDEACVFLQQGLEFVGEEVGIEDKQLTVLLLPLVAVGLCCAVFEVGFEMGGFVEEDPEEEVGIEVAVDGNLMEVVVGCGASIIAEFSTALEGDVEVNLVAEEVVVDSVYCHSRQMIP
jgi:hypothetical protein